MGGANSSQTNFHLIFDSTNSQKKTNPKMVKTSILISSIFSMGALGNPLLEQLGRKFSMLGTMLFTQTNTTLTSGDISKRIQQYGCYCFGDATNSGVLFGNGEPV